MRNERMRRMWNVRDPLKKKIKVSRSAWAFRAGGEGGRGEGEGGNGKGRGREDVVKKTDGGGTRTRGVIYKNEGTIHPLTTTRGR